MATIHLFYGSTLNLYTPELVLSLSFDEQCSASKFVAEQDRETFITCRYFLRLLLSQELKKSIEDIQFKYSVNGKPFLEDGHVHFNVAHTGTSFIIALTDVGPIGVDIEFKSRKFEFSKLNSMLFSEAEYEAFNRLDEADKNGEFIKCWTRKEAFFKAKGSGLSSPLKELEIGITKAGLPQILSMKWDSNEQKEWTLQDINLSNIFTAAVAVKSTSAVQIIENLEKLNCAHPRYEFTV